MPTTAGRLALELGVQPEQVLDACQRTGISVFGEQTPLDDRETHFVRAAIGAAPPPPMPSGPPLAPGTAGWLPPPPPGPPRRQGGIPTWAVVALVGVIVAVVLVGAAVFTGSSDDVDEHARDATVTQGVAEGVPFGAPTTVAPVTTPTSVVFDPITGLGLGDCWTDPNVPDLRNDSLATGEYTVVPCAQPHQAEVYAIVAHPDPPRVPYPGDYAMLTYSDDQCAIRFQGFVGRSLYDSLLNGLHAHPNERSWLMDDRIVVCSVYALDGSLLTGSVQGSNR